MLMLWCYGAMGDVYLRVVLRFRRLKLYNLFAHSLIRPFRFFRLSRHLWHLSPEILFLLLLPSAHTDLLFPSWAALLHATRPTTNTAAALFLGLHCTMGFS